MREIAGSIVVVTETVVLFDVREIAGSIVVVTDTVVLFDVREIAGSSDFDVEVDTVVILLITGIAFTLTLHSSVISPAIA